MLLVIHTLEKLGQKNVQLCKICLMGTQQVTIAVLETLVETIKLKGVQNDLYNTHMG